MVIDGVTPPQQQPDGKTSAVDGSRDLQKEKTVEAKKDHVEATAKRSQYETRRINLPTRPVNAAPEYESLILKSATNNRYADLIDYSPSTFIPDMSTTFYTLAYMDTTMASTKRWTDNCMGWVPPISQMYISLLIYVHIARAMDSSSLLGPMSELKVFLDTFNTVFPMTDLWVPGPLVPMFRNLSAFWPSLDDQFGNVSPTLPDSPSWSARTFFSLGQLAQTDVPNKNLPNISVFISRLRTICALAVSTPNNTGMTQPAFTNAMNGPNRCNQLFGRTVDNTEVAALSSPGSMFAYPDQLPLWINANYSISRLQIPQDLSLGAAPSTPADSWTSFIRFANNEHTWFGPVSAVMAKYSQFWNGSTTLSEIAPNTSAACAVKLRYDPFLTDIHQAPIFHPAVAQVVPPNPNPQNIVAVDAVDAYYALRTSARVVVDGTIALKGMPDAHVFASSVFTYNAYDDDADQAAARHGNFWTLGPDILGRRGLECLPGVLSTIIREYHSDSRIQASKQ
jgi:hypothetical protein